MSVIIAVVSEMLADILWKTVKSPLPKVWCNNNCLA
ncbi:hypothetical protein AWRI1631_120900 [Saccharomyces cerevisiae AWRI1631]|uniref:Uncharacterized protein n=1 Tax=Saccharomyces cerevisiae (strain AWRI1631) TaxID=545124 RepID=B5VMX8_YEAS6|nr:hypothetical protein AWRI1631_120900 [Saccharomyces cerevisiae AWRI1631]